MAETKTEKIEREYVIPLRAKWKHVARYKKANRAVKAIKEFLVRHMKIRDGDLDKVRVDKILNEYVWSRGIRSPPSKIKVKAVKEGDIVRVHLAELPKDLRFKKEKLEKRNKKATEIVDKKKSTMERLKEAREHKEENKAQETPEEAKEKEEKQAASIQGTEMLEKETAKQEKHIAKAKSPKQEKNQRVGYNQATRGQ